ncbi:hypothetical protein BT93_J0416 [Corymbia citriodora subsp. variegata]|nr:hypothetical protein BT93_J0416 [Corymbia citriodora subsp. variegata]
MTYVKLSEVRRRQAMQLVDLIGLQGHEWRMRKSVYSKPIWPSAVRFITSRLELLYHYVSIRMGGTGAVFTSLKD